MNLIQKFSQRGLSQIVVPLYDAQVYLLVSSDYKLHIHIYEVLNEHKASKATKYMMKHCEGCCHTFGYPGVYLIHLLPDRCTVKVMAHEIFHLVHRILEDYHCHHDEDHHEQGAMLQGWLMTWLFSATKKYWHHKA